MVVVHSCDPEVQIPSKKPKGVEKNINQSIKQSVSAAFLVK